MKVDLLQALLQRNKGYLVCSSFAHYRSTAFSYKSDSFDENVPKSPDSAAASFLNTKYLFKNIWLILFLCKGICSNGKTLELSSPSHNPLIAMFEIC